MRWFAWVLVGLVILGGACGGVTGDTPDTGDTGIEAAPGQGTGDEGASGGDITVENLFRDALEAKLEPSLLRELPALEEEEASCLSDAVLAELPDFRTALADIESFAEDVLDATQAAQEGCLTPERIAELGVDETAVLPRESAEKAFLLVIRGKDRDLDAEDQEIVDAGYLLCGFAEEAGSLDTLVDRLSGTPASSAKVVANLMPLLGKVLRDKELITFTTTAVVILCPEVSGPPTTVGPS